CHAAPARRPLPPRRPPASRPTAVSTGDVHLREWVRRGFYCTNGRAGVQQRQRHRTARRQVCLPPVPCHRATHTNGTCSGRSITALTVISLPNLPPTPRSYPQVAAAPAGVFSAICPRSASSSPASEIFGRDVVQELPEGLDLVLLLVGHRHPRLVDHVLVRVDRGSGTQCQGDGVRRTGADLRAIGENEFGVEDTVTEARDVDGLQPGVQGLEYVTEQVVGERPGGRHPLLGKRDGRGLHTTDPDRQVAITIGFFEQDNRLVRGHLNPDADDLHVLHSGSVPRVVMPAGRSSLLPRWIRSRGRNRHPSLQSSPEAGGRKPSGPSRRRGRAPHGRTYVFLATWFGQQHHPELTDLNLVPAAQLGFVDRLPVDVGAVQTAHVANTETVATPEEFHMATGNGDVVQKDVAVGMTARGGHVTVQQETASGVGATTHHEQGGTGRERIGAGRVVPTGNLTEVFFLQNLDTGDG